MMSNPAITPPRWISADLELMPDDGKRYEIVDGELYVSQDDRGKPRTTPELAVEVLSPGLLNERRDREAKLKLYARRGVDEYWIVDWRLRAVDVYRRNGATLDLVARVTGEDVLESPLLPGFTAPLSRVFPARE